MSQVLSGLGRLQHDSNRLRLLDVLTISITRNLQSNTLRLRLHFDVVADYIAITYLCNRRLHFNVAMAIVLLKKKQRHTVLVTGKFYSDQRK